MFHIQEYNRLMEEDGSPNKKVSLIISQVNENKKFIKHVSIKSFFYIHLYTHNPEMSRRLNRILQCPYEGDRRHETAKYLEEVMRDPENTKEFIITHIYQV